jgi:arylsulfatase A-like enzyme
MISKIPGPSGRRLFCPDLVFCFHHTKTRIVSADTGERNKQKGKNMRIVNHFRYLSKILGAVALLSMVAVAAEKPNILMISVDDLNDWVGVYCGNPQCKTPNIDAFAKKAMTFRNASCPAPVCGPSRSALLSGFMPSTTGVYGNSQNMLHSELVKKNTTLPEYFSKHGYLTISRGKIFHGHGSSDQGQWAFDIWKNARSTTDGPNKEKLFSRNQGIINGKKIKNAKYTQEGGSGFEFGPTIGGKEGTKDYETAKWFEQQLKKKYDKPFFMSVGISRPHLPFFAPQEYFDLYDRDSVKVPEFRMDDLDDIVSRNGRKIFKPHDDFLWCQEYGVMKDAVHAYMASTSYADDCIGLVLDALAKSKYAKNTIVLIWGDHGWHLGEKLKFRKTYLWREATQNPLIIRVPGMKKGLETTRNVNLIDLYPTLIDLCDLPKKKLDGKSLKPLLENPNLKWTPTITTMGKGNHSVMSEKWHFITRRNGVDELYDLEKDPMEWNNLIHTQPDKSRSITSKLKPFLPVNEAASIKASKKGKTKSLGLTIKKTRDLSTLK